MAIPRLKKLGLSDKEAKVYVAALEIGAATADQLAKQAKLNRSTTYVQLQELMQFGLMSTYKKGKKTFFAPESPHNLTHIIERRHRELDEQERLLESFVPELLTRFKTAGVRPVVRSFEGKQGLITMRNEVLKASNKDIHILIAYGHIGNLLSAAELADFTEKRIHNKIFSHVLYTKDGKDLEVDDLQELRRVAADKFPFESDIYIFDNKVALTSFNGEVMGVIIESTSIANTMRSMFALMWQSVK